MKTREERKRGERGREAASLSLFQTKSLRVLFPSLLPPERAQEANRARIAATLTYRTPTPFHGRWRTLLSWGVGGAVG